MGFYICNVCCVNGKVLVKESGFQSIRYIWINSLLKDAISNFKPARLVVLLPSPPVNVSDFFSFFFIFFVEAFTCILQDRR